MIQNNLKGQIYKEYKTLFDHENIAALEINSQFSYDRFWKNVCQNSFVLNVIRELKDNLLHLPPEKGFENYLMDSDPTYDKFKFLVNDRDEKFWDRNRHNSFDTIEEQIYYHYKLLEEISIKDKYQIWSVAENFSTGVDKYEIIEFKETYIYPFVNYFLQKLDDFHVVLNLMIKYKAKREWFYKQIFFDQYKKACSKSKGENFLEMDFRAYLFDNGIRFPFSSPQSPSGKADVVANINSSDPLVLEVKFIDKSLNYGIEKLKGGTFQIIEYLNDYQKEIGFLLIFNADDKWIKVNLPECEEKFPQYIKFNGKLIYVIAVNINPSGLYSSASNIKEYEIIELKSDELSA